jgi:CRISPR/Cas system-associated exonuclease Cas4 (RecB family)
MVDQKNKPKKQATEPAKFSKVFKTDSELPFKLSRSRIEKYVECPRCSYLDIRHGIKSPGAPPYVLNLAVDRLLKKEFDAYRVKKEPHPIMVKYGIDAIPFWHENFEDWKNNWKGIQVLHQPTNFLVTGAVDELWVNPSGEVITVDYKATSKKEMTNDLHPAFRRQMDVYQWLLRKFGLAVARTGYFVFCNAQTDRDALEARLDFEMVLVPYLADDSWVEPALLEIRKCLDNDKPPDANPKCEVCAFVKATVERGG